MTRQEVLDTIKSLARSQGSYGRLYQALTTAEGDTKREVSTWLDEACKCNDVVDLIMWIEE